MTALATLAALLALWLLGAAVLTCANARSGEGTDAVSADFAAGAAVLAFAGMAAVSLGAGLSLTAGYLLVAAFAALGARRLRRPLLRVRGTRAPAAGALLCAAGALLAAVLTTGMQDRLVWDGWGIWTLKARVLFVEGTLPRDFLDPAGVFASTNLDYPLAVPLVDWWLYQHAGAALPALASFMGAVWFLLLALVVWGALRDRVDHRLAAAATLGTAAFWPVAFFATGGTADVVVALALLGGVVELERGLERHDAAALGRAAAYVALGALAKNEGIALAVLFAIVGGAFLLRAGERRLRRFLPLFVPLLAVAPWVVFVRLGGVRIGAFSAGADAAPLGERVSLFLTGVRVLFSSGPWLPLPLLAGVGVAAAARQGGPGVRAGWTLLGGYVAVLCATYLQAEADMMWLLSTSLPRVLGAVVPALVFLSTLSAARDDALPDAAHA